MAQSRWRQPLTGVSVTVPTLLPFSVSAPPGVTEMITDEPADAAAPSSSATDRLVATPFATAPVVLTLMLQGLTVTVWPSASE